MLGLVVELSRRRPRRCAEVHDQHAVGDVADDVEVVRDEDVGEAEVALEVLEQVQDLRLHGDVERRDRLVADDQLRVDGERARDADALALAAGELVREAVVVLGIEPDDLEQLLDTALDLRAVPSLCTSSASATMKPTRLRAFRDAYGSWKIIIISRRIGRISERESFVMSRPSKTRRPSVASSRRMTQRAIVDFPQPDSPTTPSVSPRLTLKLTPSTAFTAATCFWNTIPRVHGKVLLEVLDDEQLVAADPSVRRCRLCSLGCLRQRPRGACRLAVLRLLVEVAALQVLRLVGDGAAGAPRPCRSHDVRAARVEAAAARRVEQRRRLALDLHEALDVASRRGSEPSSPTCTGAAGA
jgi:hypothetical protein